MSFVRDGIVLSGFSLVVYGLWQWTPALGYVAIGAALIALALFWKLRAGRNPQ